MNDPVSAKELVTGKEMKAGGQRVVAQATDKAVSPRKLAVAQETPAEGFDRKSGGTPAAASDGRRPPKREEKTDTTTDRQVVKVKRKGTFVGVIPATPNEEVPPGELYPFSPIRRTFPDANTMTVELAIKNASGMQWKTAYIALRSARHNETVQFQVSDWQIDEIVGLDYSFPKDEVQNRLFELRVVSVGGDKRESALADRLQQSRRKYVESTAPKPQRSTGETLTAVGLLGMMGRMQAPVTGVHIKTAEGRIGSNEPIVIVLSESEKIPADFDVALRETSDERKTVADLAKKFHESAIAVQEGLVNFTAKLGTAPYEDAMKGEAGVALKDTRAKLETFNDVATELATKIQISTDSDIRKLSDLVPSYSRKILGEVSVIESRIQSVDEDFKVQQY